MATLRASAFILNGMLLLVGLFVLADDGIPQKAEQVVIFILLFGAPIVSIITIAVLSRKSVGNAGA